MDRNSIDANLLLNVYDVVRVVNPVAKCVLDEKEEEKENYFCYDCWKTGMACENCISARALQENRSVLKFEYVDEKLFMITAIPEKERLQVIELLRDVTDEHLLEDIQAQTDEMIMEKLRKLNQEVITDSLTGIYNRRFLNERLPYELINVYKEQVPFSIVMVDIDYFKYINDTYGHPIGDQVLVELSALLKKWVRGEGEEDWVVRYGGEEFLLFMKKIPPKLLKARMEMLRQKVGETTFCADSRKISLTISIGMFNGLIIKEEQIENYEDLIHSADEALYEAKNNGRNQCVIKVLD